MSMLTRPNTRIDLSLCINICCIARRQRRGAKKGVAPSSIKTNQLQSEADGTCYLLPELWK